MSSCTYTVKAAAATYRASGLSQVARSVWHEARGLPSDIGSRQSTIITEHISMAVAAVAVAVVVTVAVTVTASS